MLKNILIVGLGSFAGGALRYTLSLLLSKVGKILAFPIAIFIINILGSFMIGLLYSYFKHKTAFPTLPLLLITGLLGGFTTFSTFSLETLQLFQQNQELKASFYIVGSIGLSILACFLGSKIYS